MKRLLYLILIVVFALSTPARAAESLRVAVAGVFPPFNFIDDKGQLAGFDVEIAQALCVNMERQCEFIIVPWQAILQGLVDGKYDAIISSMSKTKERAKLVDFTESYYRSRSAFVGKAGLIPKVTLETVRGLRLSTTAGTLQAKYLQQFKDVATLKFANSTKECFLLLAHAETDIVLSDNLAGIRFLTSDQGKNFDFLGDPLPANNPFNMAHIAVRKGYTQLKDELDQALKNILLNGEYDKVNRKYFPFSIH